MIRLEKIDAKNVWDVIELKVYKAQKDFVASNDLSLLQAFTAEGTGCSAFPFAIYNGKKPVGFIDCGNRDDYKYLNGLADEPEKDEFVITAPVAAASA